MELQLPRDSTKFSSVSSVSTEYYSPMATFKFHEPTFALDLCDYPATPSCSKTRSRVKRRKSSALARKLRGLGARLCGARREPKAAAESAATLVVDAWRAESVQKVSERLEFAPDEVDEVNEVGGDEVLQQEEETKFRDFEFMNGTWQQNKELSDATDELCQVLSLGWVFKQALDKSDVLEVEIDETKLKQVARLFKLVDFVEVFPMSGEEVLLRRRDLRRGPLHGSTVRTPLGYKNSLWWDNPCKGGMTENLVFSEDGQTLDMQSDVWTQKGQKCTLRTKWNRIR